MKKTLVIDFETDDKYIGEGKGAGWVWGIPVLGMAVSELEGEVAFLTTTEEILSKIAESDTLICHNAQYEAGVLLMLGVDIRKYRFIDTLILSKLFDNSLFSHGLGELGEKYLGMPKDELELGLVAKRLGLVKSIAQNAVTKAKENMGLVFKADPGTVAKYAKVDVEITRGLFKHFGVVYTEMEDKDFYSDLIKSLVISRKRGVRVSVKKAEEAYTYLKGKEDEANSIVESLAPGVNINSSKQLGEYFDSKGFSYSRTEKGAPSFTKEFFQESDIPLCKAITDTKLYQKARRDFVEPILEQAKGEYVLVHPEIKIFGATATGRASSSNPNIQQIPKRNKELKCVRDMYVPFEEENWYCLDFSSQEPRLQVHYAYLLRAPGAETMVKLYKEDPRFDLHTVVANMAGIDRTHAKTINLGVSYGMGKPKLAKSLNTTLPRAVNLLTRYHEAVPYLISLDGICKKSMKIKGFIRTLAGRRLRNERGFEYKALNKLVQGSAADQTYACMVAAYRNDLTLLFPIHDELCFSGTLEQAKVLQNIMQNTVKLEVPSVSDIMGGPSWGEAIAIQDKDAILPVEGSNVGVTRDVEKV